MKKWREAAFSLKPSNKVEKQWKLASMLDPENDRGETQVKKIMKVALKESLCEITSVRAPLLTGKDT